MKWFRSIAFILSIVCLLSIVGCKRQSDPTIESSDVSSVTAEIESLISSEEAVPSESQEPVSSELSTASKPEQVTSSQPEPSSITETPSSPAEPSEPEPPTIPFEIGYQEIYDGFLPSYNWEEEGDPFKNGGFKTVIVRSIEELNQNFDIEQESENRKAFLKQCDVAYFEKNAIVYVRVINSASTSLKRTVDPITRSENQLVVNLYHDIRPGEGLPVVDWPSTEEIFITVKQSDLEGIDRATVNHLG